ncbi:MAG: hypothetical protein CMM84_03470 [Rhodothermaceae bacterium]|nr:hypothetical protein [Rhodothermaceae bacterium]MBC15277.1 hypothetical protein [Rhodothermaceae bacterium]
MGPGQRECPSCGFAVDETAEVCPFCAYEFPVPKAGMKASAWLFVGLMLLFAFPALLWLLGWFG